jgi:hypothetical protein
MWGKRISRFTASRNPLRRRSDRIEAWVTFAVVMTILLIAPLAGWWAGRESYRQDLRTSQWERQHRFSVTAVLLRDATATAVDVGDATVAPAAVRTPARWTDRRGLSHSGVVFAGIGAKAGDTVPVWVDEAGSVAGAPAGRNPGVDVTVTAMVTAFGVTAVLAALRRLVVWRLDRRRLQSWQAEWAVVGPRWSHR